MVETTFLHDKELGRPSGDVEIDQLLAEVRHRTDRNYQVVVHRLAVSHVLRRRVVERVQLYLHVGGVAPWQVLTCAYDRATIRAFLFGLINGHDHETRRESPAAEMRKRAMRAHEACYQAMVAHPEIDALQDDGVLHDAIHDILRVDGGYFGGCASDARNPQ